MKTIDKIVEYHHEIVNHFLDEITKLKVTIENMKNCENCKHSTYYYDEGFHCDIADCSRKCADYNFRLSNDLWEMK